MCQNPPHSAYFPGRAPIDAYGNGGFRFADMSHRGSLLILGDGIRGWSATCFDDAEPDTFAPLFANPTGIDFILFGTGTAQHFPSAPLREAFAAAGIGLEVMSTGAACRTYNVLLGEKRAVGAALIAVP